MSSQETRRTALTALGAAIAAPGFAMADPAQTPTGSHIPLSEGTSAKGTYQPPSHLSTALDLFRRMTAPVYINGQGPFPFVVDTGANQSVMSEELALQLNLPKGTPQTLHSVASARMTEVALVDNLHVGDVVENKIALSLLPATALGGPGLLGVDRLDDQRLTLNFGARQLLLQASRHAWRDPNDVVLQAKRRDGQLTLVNAKMSGIDVVAFLDTGAQSSIGNMALKAYAEERIAQNYWTRTTIISATGEVIEGQRAVLSQFSVGDLKIGQMAVTFADLHTFKIWNLLDRPAILLGIDILSQFQTVALDFPRAEVRLQLPSDPDARRG